MASASSTLYQPSSGRMLERRFKLPLGFRNPVSPDPGRRRLRRTAPGRNLLRLENRMAHREKRLLVELDDGTRIDACFSEEAPSFQPMCLCTPTAVNGWVYAQKVAGVRCRGDVRSALGDHDLRALDAFAHHDWSAGYMRPETFWNWACLSGEADGLRVGLNLSCGVQRGPASPRTLLLAGRRTAEGRQRALRLTRPARCGPGPSVHTMAR
ncbi:hypothetical protein ACPA9J_31405 [Pseudomonas aeruginosa]